MSVYKRDENYWIDYYLPNGKRKRKKIGTSKKQAERILNKFKTEIVEGKYIDRDNRQRVRLKAFSDRFLTSHCKVNKSSWGNDEILLRQILDFFGDVYLDEITPEMVENLKAHRLSVGAKKATVNRVTACLRTMFNKAIEWGVSKDTPMKRIKLFKEDNMRMRYLTKEEIQRLVDNCPTYLKNIVICALNTGMRRGELLNLKWVDIDFRNKFIRLTRTKTKTQRMVPINSIVERLLLNLKERSTNEHTFCYNNGKRVISIENAFKKARKNAEINDFKFHDLRHSAASYLVMNGVDLNTVKEILGHTTINMTMRYSHLSQDHKLRAVETLGRAVVTIQTPEQKEEKDKILYLSQVVGNKEVNNSVPVQSEA